jgi:hypothetical protein
VGCPDPGADPEADPEVDPDPEPPAAGPPNPAPGPPPNSPVHAPFTGALIRTAVAVRPDDVSGELPAEVVGAVVVAAAVVGAAPAEADAWPEPPGPGAPPAVASTQEPTVTALMSAVLVWLIVVAAV